jgi:NADH-ubiquinone oxidoreductase chain 5
MYLSIIILPLLGSIVSGFFGRKVGVTGSRILSCLSIITTTILAIISFFEVGFNNNPISINLFKWLDSESFNMVWNFQFDSLTVSMLIPVLVISSLVHFYSIGYMSHDPHSQRFFSYLSLFTFMMIILVTGNNYLVMFVGWEGVGVCSYLLISFWFTRIAANQSSLSAFLTNRVGDCFLTIGMFVTLWSLGNLDYSTVFSLAPYINENIITIIGICLLIGAMAKSSQVGLHIWLPMAMEGPTPVSALIHAATMVTAGVYLLIRSSPLIEYSSTVLLICLWLGAVTTVFSSLIGLFQQDIKKIIAYSTMSQLGMMVIAIGLSSYNVAIFHLINHAFYKGLLFLGAGAVIHAVVDNQDLRKYGGLISFLPLTYTVILIASLSLVAFPFMTGFFSKDFILESAYGQYHFSSINVYFIATIGAVFTTLYSVKVIYLTFLANPNGSVNYYKNAHEGDIFISLPLVILAIFSIYFGYLTKDIYIGLGSGFFIDNSIFIHPMREILIDTEFGVPTIFKLLPFILTILFSALAIIYPEFMPNSVSNFKLSNIGYYIYGFFNQRFLVEFFYNKYIVNTVLDLGGQTTKILDKGSIEWIGPYGFGIALVKASKTVSGLGKGVVTDYALYILIGACFYLSIFTFISIFFDLANSITLSCVLVLLGVNNYVKLSKHDNINENSLTSSLWSWSNTKEVSKYTTKIILFVLKPKILFKIFKLIIKKFISIILKPSVIFSLLIYLIGILGLGTFSDTVSFDGSDDDTETKNKDSECDNIKEQNSEPQKDIGSSRTSDYSNSSKWYVERMKHVYEQMMEHESKWLEEEKKEYERTKVLPENSLHSIIAESREQDAKEMMAINEALNKFNLDENSNDISSSDNKRSIAEEDQSFTASEGNKKSRIVTESETDVDNVTNEN